VSNTATPGNSQQRSTSSSSLSCQPAAAAGVRRRSIQTINEERSRFRIVKIDSYVDRGRWHCHNFADPPMHDTDLGSSAQYDPETGDLGDDDASAGLPPSQIYYIATGAGQNDVGDLSRKFYVSTIVYGVHGHPVLDRTVRMSPLQLLRHASDDDDDNDDDDDDDDESLPQTDTADTLTPNTRHSDSPLDTSVDRHVDVTDETLPTTSACQCDDLLTVDDSTGHVTSDDIRENEMAHSSAPSTMKSASDRDDVMSRYDMTSRSICQQENEELRCRDDSRGQPACRTQQHLSVDESSSLTRFASSSKLNVHNNCQERSQEWIHSLYSITRLSRLLLDNCILHVGIKRFHFVISSNFVESYPYFHHFSLME